VLNQTIEEQARPEQEYLQRAEHQVEELESAFELEENKEETRKRQRRIRLRDIVLTNADHGEEQKVAEEVVIAEPVQQIPEMTTDEKQRKFDFNNEEKVDKITSVNPVRDFEKMITDREVDRVDDALKQMREMILEFVRNSTQGDMYEKAIDCLKAMRKASADNDEADQFNAFLADLKKRFSMGIHKDYYEAIRQQRIGLITKEESFKSKITQVEANEFFGLLPEEEVKSEPEEEQQKKKEENMFDELD
jgi:ATP-dependent DNA helicase 2 subunit 2